MTREQALKALDDAFAVRIDHMFQNLADTFAGSKNAIEVAEKHFADGMKFSVKAFAFAQTVIEQNFPE